MKRTANINIILYTAFFLFSLPVNNTSAIPAFARKYQIICQVCHSPVMPRLKGFGEEFSGNGFRLTEYESPRYFIQAGDDKLSLFRELPVAPGNFTADLKYDRGIILEKDISAIGTTLVGEVINGCGIGEAEEGYLFDKDKHKNFMLKINQVMGKKVSAGFFGYYRKEDLLTLLACLPVRY